jgi:saccharopine dehydrogenase-like NADP-dependent oxidoreductase
MENITKKELEKFNVKNVSAWVPLESEFNEYKNFTNSDLENYAELLKNIDRIKNQFANIAPFETFEMSVREFSKKLIEFNLPNTPEGRRICSIRISFQNTKKNCDEMKK